MSWSLTGSGSAAPTCWRMLCTLVTSIDGSKSTSPRVTTVSATLQMSPRKQLMSMPPDVCTEAVPETNAVDGVDPGGMSWPSVTSKSILMPLIVVVDVTWTSVSVRQNSMQSSGSKGLQIWPFVRHFFTALAWTTTSGRSIVTCILPFWKVTGHEMSPALMSTLVTVTGTLTLHEQVGSTLMFLAGWARILVVTASLNSLPTPVTGSLQRLSKLAWMVAGVRPTMKALGTVRPPAARTDLIWAT